MERSTVSSTYIGAILQPIVPSEQVDVSRTDSDSRSQNDSEVNCMFVNDVAYLRGNTVCPIKSGQDSEWVPYHFSYFHSYSSGRQELLSLINLTRFRF